MRNWLVPIVRFEEGTMKYTGFFNMKGAPICKPRDQFVPSHKMVHKSAWRTYVTLLPVAELEKISGVGPQNIL